MRYKNSWNTEVPIFLLLLLYVLMGVRFNALLSFSPFVLNTVVSEGVDVIIPASRNIMKALIRLELRIGLEL